MNIFLVWLRTSSCHLNLQYFFRALWLMCSEMIAYLLSAVLLRFHHSVLMVFLPVFKKEVMGNQAVFPS